MPSPIARPPSVAPLSRIARFPRISPLIASLGALLGALGAGSGCGGRDVRPVAEIDFKDLAVPTMIRYLGGGVDLPWLVELPPREVKARFDLRLDRTDDRRVFDAICALDPTFRCARVGATLVAWPAGEEGDASPYSRRIESFHEEGTAGEVLQRLLERADLPKTTRVTAQQTVVRRQVRIDLDAGTVRDALAALAQSAHAGILTEPGAVQIAPLPPVRD